MSGERCVWHGKTRDHHCAFCKSIVRDQVWGVVVWSSAAMVMAVLGFATGAMIAMIVGGIA